MRPTMSTEVQTMQALYDASMAGCVSTLNTVIQQDPLILHRISQTSYPSTPLHISALIGHVEFTQTLVNHKPKLASEMDSGKRTPLHLAAAEGHVEIVKILLQASTHECLVYDHGGKIPLHHAAARGRVEVVGELIRARPESVRMAGVNGGGTVFHMCVKLNHLECLKLLVESLTATRNNRDCLNSKETKGGNTILELAFSLGHMEIFRYLLSIPMVSKEGISNKMTAVQKQTTSKPMSKRKHDLPLQRGQQSKPNKGVWLNDTQGVLMLVATVISTITFQAAVNPPGGVLQDNKTGLFTGYNCTELDTTYGCHVGTAVLAYTAKNLFHNVRPQLFGDIILHSRFDLYTQFTIANTLSFLASLSVTFLILSRLPLKNYFCMCLLIIIMCVSLTALAVTYLLVIISITPNPLGHGSSYYWMVIGSVIVWILILVLVGVVHAMRFLVWLGKKIFNLFNCKRRKKIQDLYVEA